MLRASGKRVGLFTSPHLHSFRERIRLDGELVSKEAIVAAMEEIRPAVEAIGYASPFEKLSALAFVCFARADVEWAVLETGLGGRWDCTNHCQPEVCGITRIGLDHMNVLGDTVGQIASEKAGIMKSGIPACSVPQDPAALLVLEEFAKKSDVELHVVHEGACDATLPTWLSPAHQRYNAALATSMMHSLAARGLLPPQPEVWRVARDKLSWPARFELFRPTSIRCDGDDTASALPAVLIDVAHNQPAIEALLKSVDQAYPNVPLAVIFGMNRDKDVRSVVDLFAHHSQLYAGVAVLSSHPKAIPADEIASLCQAAGMPKAEGIPWQAAATMIDALHLASAALRSQSSNGLILCCGSVFVAADMRAALAELEPQLFAAHDFVFEQHGEPHLLM